MLRAPEPGPGYKKEEFSAPGRNPSAGCSLLSIPPVPNGPSRMGRQEGGRERGTANMETWTEGSSGTQSKPETQVSPSNVKTPAPHLEPGNPLKGMNGPSAQLRARRVQEQN